MIQGQLSELEHKHRILEKDIAEALRHRSVDDLALVNLKKQRLLVKEQIEHIREVNVQATALCDATSLQT